LKEIKRDFPINKNLKFSKQSQDPSLSQFSALLDCRDTVFNRRRRKQMKPPWTLWRVRTTLPIMQRVTEGDIFAFKIVEMGENYALEVFGFKEWKVLECDGTNTVTFELLKMTKKKQSGKFEIEDDVDIEKIRTFNWAELIKPRLMFP
jgi:hypothetical protein